MMPNRLSPMKYFTHEEIGPSETTLSMIRQIAYTYRVMKGEGENVPLCMN